MTDETKINVQSILTHQKFNTYCKYSPVLGMDIWHIYDEGGGFVEILTDHTMWKIYERT